MTKLLTIALKDLTVMFRDRGALIFILLTPFVLTLVIAFAFGGGDDTGLADIPVALVNNDSGQLGQALVDVFKSEGLADLLEPTVLSDATTARVQVDDDQIAAAVIIPADFSASVIPSDVQNREQSAIEIYVNPTRSISVGVIRAVTGEYVNRIAAASSGGQVAVTQLFTSGRLAPQGASDIASVVGERAARQVFDANAITLNMHTSSADASVDAASFDWLGYMAPSMAILFLMFNVTAGARSILDERHEFTLPRMLTTPTSAVQVLGGKLLGTYLRGVAQVGILVLASGLIFGVGWGDALSVVLVVLVLAAAATAWGMIIAAFSRTPGQVNAVGSALSLVFGITAGNFFPREVMPDFLRTASLITPNAWGLEAFSSLTTGGALNDVLVPVLALALMAVVIFAAAVLAFRARRQYA